MNSDTSSDLQKSKSRWMIQFPSNLEHTTSCSQNLTKLLHLFKGSQDSNFASCTYWIE